MITEKVKKQLIKKTSNVNIDTKKYREHLISFLNYIVTNGDINTNTQNFYHSANYGLNSLQYRYSTANWNLNISPCWKIDINDLTKFGEGPVYLLIGGNIVVGNNKFEDYSLSVCLVIKGSKTFPKSANSINSESCCLSSKFKDCERVVRRFHFDIDIDSKLETPNSHLQIGGIFNPGYAPETLNNLHYCFDHYLEIPRLQYPPVDLIILIDMILRQFKTKIGQKILKDGTWLKLVKKSQCIMFNDYYKKIQEHLNRDYSKTDERYNWTLNDFLCGGKLQ